MMQCMTVANHVLAFTGKAVLDVMDKAAIESSTPGDIHEAMCSSCGLLGGYFTFDS